jgi:penicillin-binding protein 2
MESRFRFRLYLLTALILLGTFALLHRLHQFQIQDQHYYIRQKPGFSIVSIREPGVRGEIKDRNGVALAENHRIYELVINLGEVQDAWDRQWREDNQLLAAGADEEKTEKPTIDQIVEKIVLPRLKELGVEPPLKRSALRTHFITHGNLVPYVFPGELDFDQFSRLAEKNLGLQGVYVNSRPQRHYPLGTLAGHVLGYVRQWEKGSYTQAEKDEFEHYFGDSKGMAGVEKTYNEILTGLHGKQSLYKDEKGQIVGRAVFDSRPPSQGAELTLSLDAGIQCLAENILRRAGRAAAVVMDVNTGEVLAMASVPNYDPNDYIPSLSQKSADYYFQNKGHPFTNRTVGSFMSASTTKIAVALTAAMNQKAGFTSSCSGGVTYGRSLTIDCWKTVGHGGLALEEALQRSCNPYFMNLANNMGRDSVVEGFSILNLGRRTAVGLPDESPGTLPGSQTWVQQQEPGTVMTPAQLAMTAIGQWQMETTPLQICAITACVANGGKYFRPRLLKEARLEGDVIEPDVPDLEVDLVADKNVRASDMKRIKKGMWLAANEIGGTAQRVAVEDFPVGAKTGTVQLGQGENKTNNSWTTAFAPYDDPRYAVTVFVEGGASGGKVAGPLVHLILRGIAASENNLKLPIKRMGKYAGHFDRIEEIELPKDSLLSIPLEDVGETGNEASGALDENEPIVVKPRIIPLPGDGSEDSQDE